MTNVRPSSPKRRRTRLTVEQLEARELLAVSIVFDYSLDNGFFNDSARRSLLQSTADAITQRLTDSLPAIPSGNYTVRNPATGADVTRQFSVAADTIRVFVSGRSLPGNTAGQGGPRWSSGGSRPSTSTDFAPSTGFISFDDDGSTDWFFGATTTGLTSQTDFVSVARHELLHVLGIGIQSTTLTTPWARLVSNGQFTGAKAREGNGGSNPAVAPGGGHFAEGTNAIMEPSLDDGREDLTQVDWGALEDIGWTRGAPRNNLATAETLYNRDTGSVISVIDLAPVGGVRMYRLEVLRGFNFSVTTSSFQGVAVDTYLRLFDANGQEIASDDDGGSGAFSSLEYNFDRSGVYYLGVSTFANRNYDPRVGGSPASGRFQIGFSMSDGDSGGTIASAAETDLTGSSGTFAKEASMEWEFDQDMYEFQATAGTTVTARTSPLQSSPFRTDTYLRLFDSAGRQLLARDDGGPGLYAALSFTVPRTGTYYLGVSTPRNTNYDPNGGEIGGDVAFNGGDYRLDLSLSPTLGSGLGNVQGAGFPELIGRSDTGVWFVSQNNGSRLIGLQPYGIWSAVGWADVRYGDFTGDGQTDVLGRSLFTGHWILGRNVGTGFVNEIWGLWSPTGWADVMTGDFNGDGRLDILGRSLFTGQWFLGGNTGSGFVNQVFGTWSAFGWADVMTGDFNGDGKLDILGRSLFTSQWVLGSNFGFGFNNQVFGSWGAAGWSKILSADFTGDGRPDVLGRSLITGQWWLGRNTGSTLALELWGTWSLGDWYDVMVADFAGDGKPDVVGRYSGNGQWWVGVNTGSGLTHQLFGTWSALGWTDVMAGNFSGGGKADILGRSIYTGAWVLGANQQPGMAISVLGTWANIAWQDVRAGYYFGDHADDGAAHDHTGGGRPVNVAYGDGPLPATAAALGAPANGVARSVGGVDDGPPPARLAGPLIDDGLREAAAHSSAEVEAGAGHRRLKKAGADRTQAIDQVFAEAAEWS